MSRMFIPELTHQTMSKLLIYWFKVRALLFANIQKLFGFILFIPVPPKVSTGCFIEKDGKLLVLDLTYRNGFAFPGGMVEPGESLEAGLIREVFEETGLTINSIKYIGSKEDTQYGLSVIAAAFSATFSGELRESNEGSLVWLTPEEIDKRQAYSNWKYLLDLYLQK